MKCFICGNKIRAPWFPSSLMFWKRKMAIYRYETEFDGEDYAIRAVVCEQDKKWAEQNKDVAEMLINSKVKRYNEDKQDD